VAVLLEGAVVFEGASMLGCGASPSEPARGQRCAGNGDCGDPARGTGEPPPAPVAYRSDEPVALSSDAGRGVPRPAVCSVRVADGADLGQAVRTAAERELAPWLRQCADEASIEEARLSVQFGAGPTGCAAEVTIRAEPADDRFSRCVAVGFYSLRLRAAAAGEGTVVRFPLRISTTSR
jgi:hypothetical protein